MPGNYMKGTYRSYNAARFGKPTLRKDIDTIFFDVSAEAARNGLHAHVCGDQNVNFGRPTRNPRGYYGVMLYICSHPNCRRCDIYKHFNVKLATTISRLRGGGLIFSDKKHLYNLTELGKLYLAACDKAYLGKRSYKQQLY